MAVSSVSNSAMQLAAQGGSKKATSAQELNSEITKLKAEHQQINLRIGEFREELAELERKQSTVEVLQRIAEVRREIALLERQRAQNETLTEQKVAQRDAAKAVTESRDLSPSEDVQERDDRKNPYARIFGADLSPLNDLERRSRRDILEVMTDRTPAPAMDAEQVAGTLFILEADARAEEAEREEMRDAADPARGGDVSVDDTPGEVEPLNGGVPDAGAHKGGEASAANATKPDQAGRDLGAEVGREERRRAMLGER